MIVFHNLVHNLIHNLVARFWISLLPSGRNSPYYKTARKGYPASACTLHYFSTATQ